MTETTRVLQELLVEDEEELIDVARSIPVRQEFLAELIRARHTFLESLSAV